MTNPAPSPDHAEMAELLPCPFCGDTPTAESVRALPEAAGKWGAVECCVTGPAVRTGYNPVEKWRAAAIAEWNKRAAPSESSPAGCERCGETEELLAGVGDAQHAALTKVSELRQQLATAERTIAELRELVESVRRATERRAESAELTNQQLAEKCLSLVAENDLLRARTAGQI